MLALVAAVLGALVSGERAPPRFEARVEHDVGGKPEFLAAGDVDSDGRADLVIALQSPGMLVVARGGTIAGAERIAVGGYPLRPEIVSWRATALDPECTVIAVASRATRKLVLLDLSKPGAPRRVLERDLPEVPRAICSGAIGGARDQSIVLALDGRGIVVQTGGADMASSPRLALGDVPRALAIVGGAAYVGFQDRAAIVGLQLDPPVSFASSSTRDIAAGTFGGAPGIAAVGGERGARVLSTSGELLATFETAPVPARVLVRDPVPGGDAEIVTLAFAGVACEIWTPLRESNGALAYTRAASLYAGQTPIDVALDDLDGDGLEDLAIANRDANCISVLAGLGAHAFESAPHARVGSFPTCVRALRSVDEPVRLVSIDAKEGALSLVAGQGDTWSEVQRLRLERPPRRLVCADVDADGTDEVLLWSGDAGATEFSVLSLIDGRLNVPKDAAPTRWTGSVDDCLAEQDRGRTNLWSVDADRDRIAIVPVEKDPHRGFRTGDRRELALVGGPCAIAFLGRKDGATRLAVALRARSAVAIVDGAVDSPSDSARILSEFAVPGAVRDLRAGDFDGDGVLDLAVLARVDAHSMESRVHVARVADGRWVVAAPLVAGLSAFHLACADFDGDERDDILVAAQDSHAIDLFWARPEPGGVAFQRRPALGAGLGCFDLEVADLDGDGRIDCAVANSSSDDVSVLWNRTPR